MTIMSASHRRVDPSISVNKNVTTPEGGPPTDTRTGCHKAPFKAEDRDLTQLANAEFYRYALKYRPGQQKQKADAGRRGEAHRRAQGTLRVFAVGKYQNSRSPLLMATRRPRHSLGVSGKTEAAPRLNRIGHRTVELDSDAT